MPLAVMTLRPRLNCMKTTPISIKTAKLMHRHVVTHPHDCTTSVREISKLVVIMARQNNNLTVRDAGGSLRCYHIHRFAADGTPLAIQQ